MNINKKIKELNTERYEREVLPLDTMNATEIVTLINNKDKKIPFKIETIIDKIAAASEEMANRFNKGGRLIYVGAGSSGRIGLMDVEELGPTYGIDSSRAFGLIPGGNDALIDGIEDDEDNYEEGREDIINANISDKDVVIGIAASGRTPYTLGALQEAKLRNAYTIAITSDKGSEMSQVASIAIEIETEPEIVAGSTRMGSGTAHKMITNMLSTTSMILSGRVYDQYMVYVRPSNEKLIQRSILLIQQITGVDEERAALLFEKSGHVVAIAVVMELGSMNVESAIKALDENNGRVRDAIATSNKSLAQQ